MFILREHCLQHQGCHKRGITIHSQIHEGIHSRKEDDRLVWRLDCCCDPCQRVAGPDVLGLGLQDGAKWCGVALVSRIFTFVGKRGEKSWLAAHPCFEGLRRVEALGPGGAPPPREGQQDADACTNIDGQGDQKGLAGGGLQSGG